MERQEKTTAIALTHNGQPNVKAYLTPEIQVLIAENGWGELVAAGKFEADKAMLSLEAASQTFLKSASHKTIYDVFATPTATLATLKKYRGEDVMLAAVESLLKAVASFLNVGKGFSEAQVVNTAQAIFYEYYWLTIADLKVCFRMGMTGKYGQLFDRLDGMIIFTWLQNYTDERAQVAETSLIRNLKEKQATEKATHMPEWLSEKLRKMQVRKSKAFAGTKQEGQRFATLAAFLEKIEHADNESQRQILEAWEAEYLAASPEIELDAFFVYKSNQLLYAVNLGKISDWAGVVESLAVKGNEIPEF